MIKALALSLTLAAASASAALSVGSPAPDFTLDSQDGKPVALRDLRGKWVVLYFYPKDFTRGCTIEAHNFEKDQKRYAALGATIVGVSTQSPDSHKEFCAKEGLNFKLLADVDGKVSQAYDSVVNLGVTKLSARNTFLIAPDGTLAKAFLKVSPQKHSEEVLAAIAALGKKKA
jgi:thioredoxin-dependent peroxiredoxin